MPTTPQKAENKIKALIADDERLGRDLIKHMLKTNPDVVIIEECNNGTDALSKIQTLSPDLVFLDIKMPGINGVEIVNRLEESQRPIVVFTTAHDDYAISAFDQNAVDYLLKPFDQERFDRTLDRVRQQLKHKGDSELANKIQHLLASSPSPETKTEPIDRITIKESNRVFFLSPNEIDYFEASGNYVAIHVGDKTHLVYDSLSNMESKLDAKRFVRAHRSTIINIQAIKELRTHFNGEYVVILKNGTRLKISRSYREKVKPILGLD